MMSLLEGFEKIEVSGTREGRGEKLVRIRKVKNGSYISISAEAMKAGGFKAGDRVDLYGKGDTFALKKSSTGLYNIIKNGNIVSGRINSTKLCREIKSRSNFAEIFNAWGIEDEGLLFFRVKGEQ
jgi:hypothetical protein